MENNMRFRNHPSVILENSLKTVGTVVIIFLLNFISEIGENGIHLEDVLFLVVFLVIAIGLIISVHAIIWSRTYIMIEDNMLIVEQSTINKKRNTIGLKTISNVNLEQNLLEMLLGTCKLKLDTNSLSTANQTDVSIVLKRKEAEQFRSIVLEKAENQDESMSASVCTTPPQMEERPDLEGNTIIGDMGNIILHGLFSIRISTFVLFVGILVIQIAIIYKMLTEGIGEEIFSEILGSYLTMLWFSVIMGWSILKEFIKYLNFRIERKRDKIFLKYGFFKKVAYSIPVDKINGIRLTQTPIARMAKRYMVEIINVGMDDNENETNTFFLPYSKVEQIKAQLHILLPEFDGALEMKEEKQPKEIWLLSIPWLVLYLILCVVTYGIIGYYTSDAPIKYGVWMIVGVLLIFRTIFKLGGFFTKGVKVGEKFLKIVDGCFAKRILFVKYEKIQYVTGKQCIIAKHFHMQKGSISLLASLKNHMHALPYFKENDMEQLKNYLI